MSNGYYVNLTRSLVEAKEGLEKMDPQKILEAITTDPDPNSTQVGTLTNQLLKEFHRGYPIEELRPLLHSQNDRLLNTGIWIASELGAKGSGLLKDVSPLLQHPSKRVRYLAIDCILLWSGPANGHELASTIALLEDPEEAVRWKALDFLAHASNEQLKAALLHLDGIRPSSTHALGLGWLLSTAATNPEEVISALHSQNALRRKYGAVAAARMSKQNNQPFSYASSIEDPDIKRFCERLA